MRIVLISFFLVICISCKKNSQSQLVDADQDSIQHTNEEVLDSDPVIEIDDPLPYYAYEGIQLFQAIGYRESDLNKQLFNLTDTLMGMFVDKSVYSLQKCRSIKVNVYEGECTGIPMYESTLNLSTPCLFLFKGLKVSENKVIRPILVDKIINVGDSLSIVINNVNYVLKATGNNDNGIVKNYRLIVSNGKTEQCILSVGKFEDTMPKISFAGDLDGDKKPDFIIDSSLNYESVSIRLYLSSLASKGEIVRLVSYKNDTFDC